jgi:hypothetical protein
VIVKLFEVNVFNHNPERVEIPDFLNNAVFPSHSQESYISDSLDDNPSALKSAVTLLESIFVQPL